MSKTPEKVLMEWIDANGVELRGATPAMLVSVLRGAAAEWARKDRPLTITGDYGHGSVRLVAYIPSQRLGVEVSGDNPVMDLSDLFEFVDAVRKEVEG